MQRQRKQESKLPRPLRLDPDRLFPLDARVRGLARELYLSVRDLPIISPHGHTDPAWFAQDCPFGTATEFLLQPDHYLLRMLYSQGVKFEDLGLGGSRADPRNVWRLFSERYHLFRGTPSRLWLDWVFAEVFGIEVQLGKETADEYFDLISGSLETDAFRPRALFDRFSIEFLATTEGALDTLEHHANIRKSDWRGRVATTYRPDAITDPEHETFVENLQALGELTGEDSFEWTGYLEAHRIRRAFFREHGATATDHGHPSPATANLPSAEAAALFDRVKLGDATPQDAELFRAQMLTEMAKMCVEDGMVMQIHPGSFRNHNQGLFERFGRDVGADIPVPVNFVDGLKPLLDVVGNERELTIILFTLDEATYTRELAPLAGHYPCLKLGPPWWFHDSPDGMRRFRRSITETAGFYNTVGFNDDTRAFLSIPARHDVARRIDCGFLAELVVEGQLSEEEAFELAADLSYNLAKSAYRV